jgi:hypothetical protein
MIYFFRILWSFAEPTTTMMSDFGTKLNSRQVPSLLIVVFVERVLQQMQQAVYVCSLFRQQCYR